VKRKDLEKMLKLLGWHFDRHGGSHDIWKSDDGIRETSVPRHTEIGESLSRKIIRFAKGEGR